MVDAEHMSSFTKKNVKIFYSEKFKYIFGKLLRRKVKFTVSCRRSWMESLTKYCFF